MERSGFSDLFNRVRKAINPWEGEPSNFWVLQAVSFLGN